MREKREGKISSCENGLTVFLLYDTIMERIVFPVEKSPQAVLLRRRKEREYVISVFLGRS